MRNWIAVFLFSIDHKSKTLNIIFRKIRLYDAILPQPFEHYCVFCRRICDAWWREDFFRKGVEIIEV